MKLLNLSLFFLFACTASSRAWLRACYEDETLMQRAELVAVGHLKDASIQYVPHTNDPAHGNWREYNATLVITDVLKGQAKSSEIPIIIHYGLDPRILLRSRKRQWRPTPKVTRKSRTAHSVMPIIWRCSAS